MDIFEFAKQKEKDAEAFYRDLAEKSKSEGLTTIFSRLADAELRHYRVVEHMQTETDLPAESDIMGDVGTIFNKMARSEDELLSLDRQQVAVYEKAREIEKESVDLYTEKARESDNPAHRDIFLRLAEEEKRHYAIVDQLVETVIIPEQWVENGEFSHIIDKERGTAYYPDMP